MLDQERQKVVTLSQLKQSFTVEGVKYVIAEVLPTPTGNKNELFIKRGQKDGLKNGMYVLGDNSVIGTISNVTARTAAIKLITHPETKIRVDIGNIPSILKGGSDNLASINMIPAKQKIKIGTPVFAAADARFLPHPMITGKVTACKRYDKNPLLWDITITPVCDIEVLSNVAVIIIDDKKL